MKIGDKFVKDGKVVEVKDILSIIQQGKNYITYSFNIVVLNDKFILFNDFLEQYKPYEPVFEYKYAYVHGISKEIVESDSYYLDDKDFKGKSDIKCQRLDFTKRERT